MFEPLAGVKVLDLTTSVAGPYCTMILGALGADVVKIERPDRGDDTRAWGPPFWHGESVTYLAMNPNKRSLALDLKAEGAVKLLLRLAERSDVFVQNLRPGLAEKLGLGFEALQASNPTIIYCSIGAFGNRGPRSHQPGYDPLMQAAGGIMSVTGEPDRPPVRAGVSVVDQGTGMWATIAILAALRARSEGGASAQLIETSLFETAVNWVPYQLAGYLASGGIPRPFGSGLSIIAPYEAFQASDGWVMLAAANDRLFERLCQALGLPDLASDLRFRANADRVQNRAALASAIADPFQRESASHWLERLDRAGVPAAPVQDIAQVARDEQTAALGLLQQLPRADMADLQLVAPPLSVDGQRVAHRSPPPALGADSAELLLEAGYEESEIERLFRDQIIGAGDT
jgi:crotonobetainyl-CoA:carnitine CoA-transferase CaiB-like acyl-CoA transferase